MNQSPRRAKLCIFDLDGTLVDSLRDIAEAVNEALDLLGLSPIPVSCYRNMVGEGFPALCERAVGRTYPHLVKRLAEIAAPRYRTRLLVHTRPYPGIPELISELRLAGLKLAVLSNKPHEMTLRIVRAFWSEGEFAAVQGYVREEHRKPSPWHVLEMCKALGIPPERTWLIGDTPTDVVTARAAGAHALAAAWGFRTREELASAGADFIAERPEQAGRVLLAGHNEV
jgi:phosphoglycolate phosphatase